MPSIVSYGGADVLLISRADREHERIEDDVLAAHPYLPTRDRRSVGHLQLFLRRDRLPALIDCADDHRRAVFVDKRHDLLEFLFAVLEVDRVDDRFALRILESELDHAGRSNRS